MDTTDLRLLKLADDPILAESLYRSPHLVPASIAPSGAVSVNAKWEAGGSEQWFVELQRYGTELVQAGVVIGRDDLIERGVGMIGWAFRKQGSDGGFPGTADPFHSTSLFLEGAGRACLLLKQSGLDQWRRAADEFTPKIEAAAAWITTPAIACAGLRGNEPYLHRKWIMASALGMASHASGNDAFSSIAGKHAACAISLQTPEGINQEKGGFDVNYQSAGILFAARYHSVCDDEDLGRAVKRMIARGMEWQMSKMDETGNVILEGSTRAGREILRSGGPKTMNFWELLQTLCYSASITGSEEIRERARQVARRPEGIRPDQLL